MSINPTGGTPIIDGFTYNTRVMSPASYFHAALSQLEPLRRANGWRMRIFGVPDVDNVPIPAYESLPYQIRVQPGSYLWGFNFWASQGTNPPTTLQPINSVRLDDACPELPLQDRPSLSVAFCGTQINGQESYSLGQNRGQIILPQPYLIREPGFLNTIVTNGGNTPSTCQLVLMIAEPCISAQELKHLENHVRAGRNYR